MLMLVLLLCGAGAAAQNPYAALVGASAGADGIVVSQPCTVLGVDLTVECDRLLCGPYARYAQKFLGVRAPLTDKTVWSVKTAAVSLLDPQTLFAAPAPAAPVRSVVSPADDDGEFARIQPDKTDLLVPALEDAARAAAMTIFSLRRHRMELITGEAGEHVFGEGLRAALEEIDRREQSYLELFLGKRVVTTETRRFTVVPRSGKLQYVVCRFSVADGILPESDLSGDILSLQTEPSEPPTAELEADPKVRATVPCRVAAPTACTVALGSREFVRTVLPVFEFGRTIRVAAYGK